MPDGCGGARGARLALHSTGNFARRSVNPVVEPQRESRHLRKPRFAEDHQMAKRRQRAKIHINTQNVAIMGI